MSSPGTYTVGIGHGSVSQVEAYLSHVVSSVTLAWSPGEGMLVSMVRVVHSISMLKATFLQ